MLSESDVRHNYEEALEELRESAWDDLKGTTRRMLRCLLEQSMDWECGMHVGVARYQRSPDRRALRNGFYERTLDTSLGSLRLRVPRTRDGEFYPSSLSRYQRRHADLDEGLREMFIAGVSTRRVREVLEPLVGVEVSASTVSLVAKSLDQEVAAFHARRLPTDIEYLFLDGVHISVKGARKPVRKAVLVAYGVTGAGKRYLLDFRVADSESEGAWESFLTHLCERGLGDAPVRLVVFDGCIGLRNAVKTCFPEAERQRCWVHKMRNVANWLPRAAEKREPVIAELRGVYQAPHLRGARQAFRRWAAKWRPVYPKAVACVDTDLDELLTVFAFPEPIRVNLRSTNLIERLFREVRRRSRPIGCFENKASCERVLYAVFERANRLWTTRPLPALTHKS
jgi:transposase-like protein